MRLNQKIRTAHRLENYTPEIDVASKDGDELKFRFWTSEAFLQRLVHMQHEREFIAGRKMIWTKTSGAA
jgi:hypothetical protein